MMKQKEQQFEQLFHSEYDRMYRVAYILGMVLWSCVKNLNGRSF